MRSSTNVTQSMVTRSRLWVAGPDGEAAESGEDREPAAQPSPATMKKASRYFAITPPTATASTSTWSGLMAHASSYAISAIGRRNLSLRWSIATSLSLSLHKQARQANAGGCSLTGDGQYCSATGYAPVVAFRSRWRSAGLPHHNDDLAPRAAPGPACGGSSFRHTGS
jgi:hypothetical protein